MQTNTNTTKAIIALIIIILIGLAVYATSRNADEVSNTDSSATTTLNNSTNSNGTNNSVNGTSGKNNNGSVTSPMPVAKPGQVVTVTAKKNPLAGTSWIWKDTSFNNKATATLPNSNKFVLTFGNDGALTSTTDCNSVAGRYAVNGDKLTISNTASTLMACQGATLEAEYVKQLSQVTNHTFESLNELDLLIGGSATMSFSRRP